MNTEARLKLSNNAHERRIKNLNREIKPWLTDRQAYVKQQLIRYHSDVLESQYLTKQIASKKFKRKIYKEKFNL